MVAVVVQYELKPERLEEHLDLIDAVFGELASAGIEGAHYGAMRSEEGHSFTHIANHESDEAGQAFSSMASFQAFTANIADRCIVPPHVVMQKVVGSHDILG